METKKPRRAAAAGRPWLEDCFLCRLPIDLKVVLFVGGVAAACAATFAYAFICGRHIIREEMEHVDSLMVVKLELARSHLALEEYLGGEAEFRESVEEHAGLADSYARALLEGGLTSEGEIVAFTEQDVRRLFVEVRAGIAELGALLAAGPGAEAAAALRRRNDPLFAGMQERLERAEELHREHIGAEFGSFVANQAVLAVLLLAVFLLLAYWLRRYFRETAAAESALRQSQARLQGILDHSPAVVFVKDLEGRFQLVNRRFEDLFHVAGPTIVGKTDLDIFPRATAEAFRKEDRRALAKNGPIEAEEVASHDDGPHDYLSVRFPLCGEDGKPYAVCGIATDITERKKTEASLAMVQKLESLGTLAGGIAHDFNNIMTAILGNISLAKEELPAGGETQELLGAAEAACFSARELSAQLLTFSRGGDPVAKPLSLRTLIRSRAEFAARGSNSRCVFHIDDDLKLVRGDRDQLAQVMRNVVTNAVQAMERGGVVTVRGANVELGAREVDDLPAGDYVRIAVADEGAGIPLEQLAKVFDPFFSTRPGRRGLGLAICHSVIKKHGGFMGVQSEPGRGSTFTIHLPAVAAPGPGPQAAAFAPQSAGGRLLIMDDEPMVRRVLARIAARLGYEVETVSDGSQALAAYAAAAEAGRPFAAVIMDLTIPGGMGGKEAVGRLKAVAPDAKVIVSSGYSDDPVVAGYADYGFSEVLAKPYQPGQVAAVLDKVIGAHA